MQKLVQNTCARLVYKAPKYFRITPLLRDLHSTESQSKQQSSHQISALFGTILLKSYVNYPYSEVLIHSSPHPHTGVTWVIDGA